MIDNMKYVNLAENGFLLADLSNELYSDIEKKYKLALENFENLTPHNSQLAGHIKKEFLFDHPKELHNFISIMMQEYNKNNPKYLEDFAVSYRDLPMVLRETWINFQTKTEYNPPHSHSGIFSFVIWVKIPYSLEEEKQCFPNVNEGCLNGQFGFLYTNGQGKIKTHHLKVDKSWQGKIALFPSSLMHTVYPFYTSDEYRISISGNIKMDPDFLIQEQN